MFTIYLMIFLFLFLLGDIIWLAWNVYDVKKTSHDICARINELEKQTNSIDGVVADLLREQDKRKAGRRSMRD